MAVLLSRASGNFTTNTTWGVVDATSYNNTESTTTPLTTSYQASSGSTTGAITVDGIAVKLSVRTGTTGTMSVHLAVAGVEVTGTLVTINTADLPVSATADLNGGWHFFKFASPVTLSVATSYTVEAKTSSNSQISLFSTTGSNWARALVTTTNQTPVAGDDLIVCGEYTGAGTSNSFTVTMDETATTDYGSNTTSLVTPALAVCNKGSLTYGTTGTTNYYLKLSGHAIIYSGGTLNIGTTGTPIPRGSTAVLEFDPGADGDMGLVGRNLATVNIQGLSRTSGKDVFTCKLNTDEAVNSTSLGVDTDTGWLDNDSIVVCSTSRTSTDTEKGALNGNANASDMTVDGFAGTGGGLAFAHSGTSPNQAEIINLTRSIQIRSATSTIMAYVFFGATATVDIDWAEFYYLGENVASKRGIEIATTTGSCSIQFSSVHDCEDYGVYLVSASGSNIVFSSNVCHNLDSAGAVNNSVFVTASTGVSTMSNNVLLGCLNASGGNQNVIDLADAGITFTNNTVSGGSVGAGSGAVRITEVNGLIGTFSGNITHSNAWYGLVVNGSYGTVSTHISRRNGTDGFRVVGNSQSGPLIFDTCTFVANVSTNVTLGTNFLCSLLVFKSCIFDGDATFSTSIGFIPSGSGKIYFFDCSFGSTTSHTTADISPNTSSQWEIYAFNTTFASTTEVSSQTAMPYGSFVRSHKHDASSTTFKSFYRYGTIREDTANRHTASGYAWKMTPTSATFKLILPGPTIFNTFKVAVNANTLVTIKVWVQKDGSYNGNAPRLVLVGGIVGGISSDVTASLTVGASTYEQLTVTGTPNETGVLEYYVDCDGTAGNVYVDDVTITQA